MISSINKNDVRQITAIVVDDDIDTLDVFCEYLELNQFRIVGKAYNGEKVAELYSKFKPDVVFLDVMMYNYDGIYALEQIRKVNPEAVVIMVTADLTRDTSEKLELLQASAVIYKPFDIKNVVDIVENIVGSQKNNESDLKHPKLLVQPTESTFSVHQEVCMVKK
jgi:two-component system, chemotaxis family, chemotaxis protein CheY